MKPLARLDSTVFFLEVLTLKFNFLIYLRFLRDFDELTVSTISSHFVKDFKREFPIL